MLALIVATSGFSSVDQSAATKSVRPTGTTTCAVNRRDAFQKTMSAAVGGLLLVNSIILPPEQAAASGGATAGKYTTIPIAKRRYYGRVQQGVHEFLAMGNDVVKADMTAASIQIFFDPQGALIVPARRQDIGGQCTKKNKDCKGAEIRDSRYNDMVRAVYV